MANLIKQKTEVLVMNKITNCLLIALIFAAALSYVYFANVAIWTVTVLEKTKQEMRSLSVGVSEMESERLSIENNMNIAKAEQLGFVEVDHPTFIMKNSQRTTLSLKID